MEYLLWLDSLVVSIQRLDSTDRFSAMEKEEVKDLLARFIPTLFRLWLDFKPSPVELAEKLVLDNNFLNYQMHDNVVYLNNYGSNNKIPKR